MALSTVTPFGTYTPQPLDLSDIELPAELTALREQIAENVHDVWAKSRLEQGWTYGEKRNDDLKHNPTLVPYANLSDSEKEYDRNTAEETIKLLLKMGFKVEAPA